MKIQTLGLASILLCAPQLSQPQESVSLLVGETGLTTATLSSLLQGLGTVVGPAENGYFRVRPAASIPLDRLQLQLKNVDYVLPGSADRVNTQSLLSVKNHASYLDGAFRIVHGRLPNRRESTGADFYRQLEYRLSSRVDETTGMFNSQAYKQALAHRSRMPIASPNMLDPDSVQMAAPVAWNSVGPNEVQGTGQPGFGNGPLSGRKNGAAVAPSDPNRVYVASAGGGVWRSNDGGTTFTFTSNGWAALNTACVAVHPTNPDIVYAGIGDTSGMLSGQTQGIMKSTDGGLTWTVVGSAEFGDSNVTRILINPASPSVLLALVSGPSGDIWRSIDSGQTWTRTDAFNGNWQDIDRASNGRLVAVGATAGIATSNDFGANWVPVIPPLLVGGSVWDVAVSKLDPGRWYLITSNHHIYRTLDLGIVWLEITLEHDLGGNEPLVNWIGANRGLAVECGANGLSDVVFTGLKTISASQSNGLLWSDVTHSNDNGPEWAAGQRFLQIHPTDPHKLLVCGDGGFASLDFSSGVGSSNVTAMNSSFDDVLFNGIAVHPSSRLFMMGGSFGLGTPASLGAPASPWKALYGTSGAGSAFDLANPAIHYTSGEGGEVYRYTTDGDLTPDDISPGGGLAVSPLVCAGPTGSTPTFGAANGNVRTFNGTSWVNHATGGSAVRTIGVSKFNTDRIYTGAQNGDVYRAPSINGPYTKIDANLPDRPIGGIAESPYTPDLVLVALQGSGETDGVYRCSNAAAASPSWVNISGSGETALPAIGVNDVEFDPFTNVYYAATDIGVFVSPDAGTRWYNLSALGLPNVPINDLFLSTVGGKSYLYAATLGRGVWRCALSSRFLTSILIFKPEIYGGMQNTITLKLNGSAPVGSITTITDGTSNVSMPNDVTFPLGSTQLTFTSFSVDPAATEVVTITGKVFQTTATNSFVLHKVPNFTYTPQFTDVYGGDRIVATIDLGQSAPITTVITFSDTATNIASPASTSIPQGGQTREVVLHSLPVDTTVNGTITAKIANTTRTSNLNLHPRPELTSLTLNPTSVVGGNSATGTLTTEFAGMGGTQNVAVSDTSNKVTTPGSVAIPNGSATTNFSIGTSAVTASYNVTVRARLGNVVRTAVLNVHP